MQCDGAVRFGTQTWTLAYESVCVYLWSGPGIGQASFDVCACVRAAGACVGLQAF